MGDAARLAGIQAECETQQFIEDKCEWELIGRNILLKRKKVIVAEIDLLFKKRINNWTYFAVIEVKQSKNARDAFKQGLKQLKKVSRLMPMNREHIFKIVYIPSENETCEHLGNNYYNITGSNSLKTCLDSVNGLIRKVSAILTQRAIDLLFDHDDLRDELFAKYNTIYADKDSYHTAREWRDGPLAYNVGVTLTDRCPLTNIIRDKLGLTDKKNGRVENNWYAYIHGTVYDYVVIDTVKESERYVRIYGRINEPFVQLEPIDVTELTTVSI